MDSDCGRNIIKLRGLPWNSTAKDILLFLKDCQTLDGEKSVHLAISHRDGRPNGEAFVELSSPMDVEKAFQYNKNVMGHRYIEIFNAKIEEYETCLRRSNLVQHDTFIKLRGLPFSCTHEDILQFFQGLQIRNGALGIYIVYDSRSRATGEAFVQFINSEDTDLAMKKNREKIGQRYIEIFRSSSSECRRSTLLGNNPRGSNNGGGGGNGGGGMNFNDRMGGRSQRNNRSNFRDRPYPYRDDGWNSGNNNGNGNNDAPWKNNRNNNFDNGNMFNNNGNSNNNFSSKFERGWNSGGGNNGNGGNNGGNSNFNYSYNGGDNGGGNNHSKNYNDRGMNNFSNNSNNDDFGNDNFMDGNDRMNNAISPYAVHLRGMPYDCYEEEIYQFFAPLKVVGCQVQFNNNGRHTGEADAYFATISDAQEAMKLHKEKMGSRYIELFAKSSERRDGRY